MRLLLAEDDTSLSNRLRIDLEQAGFAVDVGRIRRGRGGRWRGRCFHGRIGTLRRGGTGFGIAWPVWPGRAARLARGRQPDAGTDATRCRY